MSAVRTALAIALGTFALWASAHAQSSGAPDSRPPAGNDRFALIIGNDDYWYEGQLPKLHNAIRDAEAIAGKLERELGFTVTVKRNADQKTILAELWTLAEHLRQRPNAIGLFYFAGHGMQVNGRNFLIGVEANLDSPAIIGDLTVPADRVVGDMVKASNGLNIIILDACRDDPFSPEAPARSVKLGPASRPPPAPRATPAIATGRGLAAMQVPQTAGRDVLIAFSAGAGERASDGDPGANSLFATALLRSLDRPGLSAVEVFRQTQVAVSAQTSRRQSPFIAIQGALDFKFRPGEPPAQPAAAPAPATRRAPAADDQTDWKETKDSKSPAKLYWYLNRHPDGAHQAEATRRIAALEAQRDEADKRTVAMLAQRKEMDHWEIIKGSDDPGLFEQFLSQHPKSAYAQLAEIRLKQIRDKNPAMAAPVDPDKQKNVVRAPAPPPAEPRPAPAGSGAGAPPPAPQAAAPGATPDPYKRPPQQQAALPKELPPIVTPPEGGDVRWHGSITRSTIEFEEGAICRSAQADFRTRDGRVTGGTLILDDQRRYELDLSVKTGQRIAVEGTVPDRGVVSGVLVRLYDPLNLNFASYRFGGLVEGEHFAGTWRIDGYRCRGSFQFTRVPG